MIDAQPRTRDLPDLLRALAAVRLVGPVVPSGALTSLAHDSRAVRPGAGFIALRGEQTDGHRFLGTALEAGAKLLVIEDEWLASAGGDAPVLATLARLAPLESVVIAAVPDTRVALAALAAAWYGRPADELSIVGVTGTNGKTTTTYFVAAMLAAAGRACGRIGTLGAEFAGRRWPLANTTPLALELQALFAAMRDDGARAIAMEVSSHALALGRATGVPFAVGALTNVTRDHLDFHGSFEAYAAAKRRLFDLAEVSVLNLDDALGRRFASDLAASGRRPLTYAVDAPDADVRASEVEVRGDGSSFVIDGIRAHVPLPGRFNVANALAALACARALDVDLAVAVDALGSVAAVPGRMEHFAADGIDAIVDYAHTPDALENVLRAARETARGRTFVVFGCGGDRDRGKRPLMGAIARELADVAIVTSDNPRSEDPRAIVEEILAGAGADAIAELDRASAIRQAIALARPGDVVVVAGKGHETYQIVGTTTLHFDDREVVREALAAREAVRA